MESKVIQLAGREYTLQKLTFGKSKAWREKHGAIIKRLLEAVKEAKPLIAEREHLEDLPLEAVGKLLLGYVDDVAAVLVEGSEMAMEAICDYSAEIAEDRKHIEANAYDEEILGAFWEVAKLAFPLAGKLQGLAGAGQVVDEISRSSPSPNGDAAPTSSTEKTSTSSP